MNGSGCGKFGFKSVDKFHNEISPGKVGSNSYAYPQKTIESFSNPVE